MLNDSNTARLEDKARVRLYTLDAAAAPQQYLPTYLHLQ